jgi:hypothetical protein
MDWDGLFYLNLRYFREGLFCYFSEKQVKLFNNYRPFDFIESGYNRGEIPTNYQKTKNMTEDSAP